MVVRLVLGVAAILLALALALLVGSTPVAPGDVIGVLSARLSGAVWLGPPGTDAIVWHVRLPRALAALMVGAILATAGAAYQSVFRNPLADPYLVGVASGAGVGVALALVFPFGAERFGFGAVTPAAFVGALAAVFLVYRLAVVEGIALPASLVLAGVAISYVGGAAMSLMFLIDGQRFLTIFGWLLGGFNGVGWLQAGVALAYGLPTVAFILAHARLLNVLRLDDDQATQLGVNVPAVRRRILVGASLGTAAAVSVAGLIGFVGLVVPHVVRMLAGGDARRVLPLSLVGGAVFMVCADVLARLIIAPAGIPVGIVTTLLGGPFFLFLLRRRWAYTE